MNRFTPGLTLAFALSSLAVAAVAADVAPPGTVSAQTGNQAASSTAPSPANQAATAPTPTAASKRAPTSAADAGVRRMFCLNMAMQCFALSQQATNASSRTGASPGAPLDLRAPDIRQLVPEVQLRERLADPYEMREEQEQVQVEGTRPEVYVPGGLMTLPWAVMHPTQAWRIFLPVPSSAAK